MPVVEAESPCVADQCDEVLSSLLLRAMCQGQLDVAVQHFLVLRSRQVRLPALIERSCEELAKACSPA